MQSFRQRLKCNHQLFLLSLPALAFVFIFSYIPLYGVIIPFKEYNYSSGLWASPWIGFQNFAFLFNSSDAWTITFNTIGLNATFIATATVLSLAVALLLHRVRRRAVKVYQTFLFFPYFVSWVVASYALLGFLDMDKGYINQVLTFFGVDPILWYNEPGPWPVILTLANAWKNCGYFAVIYYAGLLGIDAEIYEAAEIDGASPLQQDLRISIPILKPLISVLVLLQVGKIFVGNFDMFYNLTRDSALLYPTTDIIDTFVYRALRQTGDIGMAAAAGLYQGVVGFFIVISANALIRRINPENALF